MRDIKVNAAFEAESPRPAEMRKPRPIFGRYYDLDALTLDYVDQFPGSSSAARRQRAGPPATFELAYDNDYYEAWRRGDGSRVVEHLALQRRHRPPTAPAATSVSALALGRAPGDQLIAASRPEVVLLDPLNAGLRPRGGWRTSSRPVPS